MTLSALVALLIALLTWAIGLDLPLRLALASLGAALAWVVPLKGGERWALEVIGERAGLAYQTALESGTQPDRFGFRTAVEERAEESLRRIETPRHNPWWLPLLVLAVGVLLLPVVPLLPSSLDGGSGVPGPGGSQGSDAGARGEPEDELVPERQDGELPRSEAAPADSGQAGRTDREGGEGGRAGEQEALERFLHEMRDASDASEDDRGEDQAPGEAGPAGEAPDQPSSRRPGEPEGGDGERRPGGGVREEGDGGDGRPAESERARGRAESERAERVGEQSGADENGAEQGGAENGQEPGSEGEEAAEQNSGGESRNPFAEAAPEAEPEAEPDPPGETSEPTDAEGAGEQRTPPEGEGGEARSPGDEDEPGEDSRPGEGAGAGFSEEQPAPAGERSEGEDLFLEGDLRPGPAAPGGAIRLPGANDSELPTGRSPESYRREVERSVSEGRIPLEYQDIIRSYFR